jgi:hypothetical protein
MALVGESSQRNSLARAIRHILPILIPTPPISGRRAQRGDRLRSLSSRDILLHSIAPFFVSLFESHRGSGRVAVRNIAGGMPLTGRLTRQDGTRNTRGFLGVDKSCTTRIATGQ